MGYAIEKLKQIKEAGVAAAQGSINQALASDDNQLGFKFLIAKAEERESKVLEFLAPQYKNMIKAAGELNLNEIVNQIDNDFNFKELLANRGVEIYLKQKGYSLEAKGSKTEQNKSDEEKGQSLNVPLPEKEQQELLNNIVERFRDNIIGQVFVETEGKFNTRQAFQPIVDMAGTYFQQLINSKVSATGLSLNNIDLGSLEVKINTNKMYITKGKSTMIKRGKFKIGLNPDTFQMNTAGEFFEHMKPIAQRLLYAIIQDEINGIENNEHLIKYINEYNSPGNIQYMQDMTVEQTMPIIRDAISHVCPAALDAFDIYGQQIAYKGSKSNLRGGLGELRALCIVEQMFPGQKYSAEGLSKINVGTSTAKESPIDAAITLLKENLKIGIQSKNTTVNMYSWSIDKDESMSMSNFYSQRLNQSLSGAEEIFFNTYSYNQPISNNNEYAAIWNTFTNNPAFIGKFNALAYKIIRQEIKDVSQVSFINDFFFMNDKLVLSSSILRKMFELTKISNNSRMITSASGAVNTQSSDGSLSTSFSYSANKNLVWNEAEGFDDNGFPFFSRGSASNVMIYYSINLSVNKLASMAISSFNP